MVLIFMVILFNIFLSLLLMFFSNYLVKKKYNSREKSSPFECGFDPMKSSRIPFSMRFFLITVIFLVFDVEIILLLPYLISCGKGMDIFSLLVGLVVLLILFLGTVHEWREGSLFWTTDYK